MRKGIVATIVIYSLVQMIGMFLVVIYLSIFPEPFFKLNLIVLFAKYFIVSVFGFILYGIHINNKYAESANYVRFILVGIIISFLSSLTSHILLSIVDFVYSPMQESFIIKLKKTLYTFPFSIVVMICSCLFVSLFHKKLKSKWNIFKYE